MVRAREEIAFWCAFISALPFIVLALALIAIRKYFQFAMF